ncbi:hypothetical protein [Streptomyces enissocaesilis]|uniref:Uncharacterized protein n=1 Tax=Streptomyces enissocaesilis TaxID=332589 RepID=A0ABN3XGE8_9ACTN
MTDAEAFMVAKHRAADYEEADKDAQANGDEMFTISGAGLTYDGRGCLEGDWTRHFPTMELDALDAFLQEADLSVSVVWFARVVHSKNGTSDPRTDEFPLHGHQGPVRRHRGAPGRLRPARASGISPAPC